MANILLLDESDLAERALKGILAKGNHRVVATDKPEVAWRTLRAGVIFDLVIMEAKLKEGGGARFLQRVRDDWYFGSFPVLIYTTENDVSLVRRTLHLGVQSYLLKPYSEDAVHAQVAKAVHAPWRARFFEDEKSFCAEKGVTPETLTQRRRELMAGFESAARTFPAWGEARRIHEVTDEIASLLYMTQEAGVLAGRGLLEHLQGNAHSSNWIAFETCAEALDFASRLIFFHLNPSELPPEFNDDEGSRRAAETAARTHWDNVKVDAGPGIDSAALLSRVDRLAGFPVLSTAAAGFQMMVDSHGSTISPLLDLVDTDPGLSAHVLSAANRARNDEMNAIDDPRAAATLLGEQKLRTLARSLPLVQELHFEPPVSWPGFWMFQVAVGRVAQFVCHYLEFDFMAAQAKTAGLLHDVGTLLLVKTEPMAFQAIIRYAREHRLPRVEAERRYLGCTTQDIAVHYATAQRLPAKYINVIRWCRTPDVATEHLELVSIIGIARHICRHAHIGASGDFSPYGSGKIAVTPAWAVLQTCLFPSFDVRKFEVQAHAFCLNLKSELSGHRGEGRPSHAQRAAELV